jgi:hypothetical protein
MGLAEAWEMAFCAAESVLSAAPPLVGLRVVCLIATLGLVEGVRLDFRFNRTEHLALRVRQGKRAEELISSG